MSKYILKGKKPVHISDLIAWGIWLEKSMETGERIVAKNQVGGLEVSTVFLGLDHSFGVGLPQLFETIIFDKDHCVVEEFRYATWEEAEVGHKKAVNGLRKKLPEVKRVTRQILEKGDKK